MAERRMFSRSVVNSARFLKMPISAQALYFHLGMNSDDEGVVEAYNVINLLRASDDDLKILVAKRFVRVINEDLVTYIIDWDKNNYIRPDRRQESVYRRLLSQEMTGVCQSSDGQVTDKCQPDDSQMTGVCQSSDGQVVDKCPHRIGKDRIGKSSIGEGSVEEKRTNKFVLCEADASRIMHSWNALGVSSVKSISNNRLTLVKARIAEHGLDDFLKAIKSINECPFLLGQNERGWVITFDWLIKPSNFAKVLEGNYKPRVTQSVIQQTKKTASSNFTERKNDIDAETLQKVARRFGVSKDDE